MRVTVPSSASKMMAHLCSVGVPIWRSRQFAEALSWPSANHWKNGAFDASSVRVKGRLHCRWLRAWRAQKPSISWSASAHSGKKDMIKTGGENVASREVEEAIYRHPAVSEVAVVGLSDPVWIEAVTAIVVVKSGHTLDEAALIAHCRASLAGFKTPKRVIFADGLPRNPSGKILKRDLRLQHEQAIPVNAPVTT
ncbi:hypothetical protein ET532_025730 [Verminephrobacter sp. Larva24]|nr:hypothetical protein ET532_025730 [Verminephrobacter sp. Larva24]